MGLRDSCCRCPESWEEFVNRWVYIVLTNSDDFFMEVQWQLREVHETYLLFRRPVVDLGGTQRLVVPCQHIAALVEAPPPVV